MNESFLLETESFELKPKEGNDLEEASKVVFAWEKV